MRYWICGVLLVLATSAQGQSFTPIVSSNGHVWSVAPETAKQSRNKLKLWTETRFPEADRLGTTSVRDLLSVDCDMMTHQSLRRMFYNKDLLVGATGIQKREHAGGGTPGYAFLSEICRIF
ncbi:hypothetical protein [Sphingomonas sp.]|uniref:hypothetical protein n=1 Tax=Sphingomonas sp. TaxID=28214 RepID=UPI00286DAF15|nr:hypothetical protein [Sphingomonas sp.]